MADPGAEEANQPAATVRVEDHMPGIFGAAETVSGTGQSRFKRLAGSALILLVVSAAGGLFEKSWAGWLSAATFAVSTVLTGVWFYRRAERDWYDGRAGAESAKSLTFKYAVGGEPFAVDSGDCDAFYTDALGQLATQLNALGSSVSAAGMPADTTALQRLRDQDRRSRMEVYRIQRLEDQRNWYSRRAGDYQTTARRWQVAMVAFELAGVTGAVLKGLDVVKLDLLSFCAAAAAGAAAWLTAGDYLATARAYSFAAFELDAALQQLDTIGSETTWARFVADAEQAMSREHTVWVTRRREP
jgi:SMODS and SLOG-associating 2TM effector domain 1/SMODS and SLOG-associating 2TM effector domain 3